MKHIHQTIAAITRPVAALTITIAALMSNTSCQKDPNIDTGLAAEKFTLSAHERRCQETEKTFDWTISPSGKTDSVDESIDDMYVTTVNELTLSSTASVNVSSTNPKAVAVQKLSATSYRLTYVADGEADIQVWNGGNSFNRGANKTQFHVKAQNLVRPTHAVFRYDGEVLKVQFYDEKGWQNAYDNMVGWGVWQRTIVTSASESGNPAKVVHHLEFVGLEPENTSFRKAFWDTSNIRLLFRKSEAEYDMYVVRNPDHIVPWHVWCEKFGYDISSWVENDLGDYGSFHKEFYFASQFGMDGGLLCVISVGEGRDKRMTGVTWDEHGK